MTARLSFIKGARPIILLEGPKPVQYEVSVALALSEFNDRCVGHTMTIVFVFELFGQPTDESYLPETAYLPPNRFVLRFRRRKPPAPLRLGPQ